MTAAKPRGRRRETHFRRHGPRNQDHDAAMCLTLLRHSVSDRKCRTLVLHACLTAKRHDETLQKKIPCLTLSASDLAFVFTPPAQIKVGILAIRR